jgi:preprotein translocase subunit SecD
MKIILKITVLLIILFLNFKIVYADETLQYVLTPDKVEMAWVEDGVKDLYQVIIHLNKPNRKNFSQLTGNNIGKRLAIIFEGRILIQPIIRGKIDSGSIVVELQSEDDARQIVDILDPTHKGNKYKLDGLSSLSDDE